MSSSPSAVLVGAIGKLPYAGMTYYWLHYIRGLQELGYEVHYVERQSRPEEYYDPVGDRMTDDLSGAVRYLESLSATFGAAPDRFTVIDRDGSFHAGDRWRLESDLEQSDFVLTVADPVWFDELARCPMRIFIDGDPMFTQAAVLAGDPQRTAVLDNYPVLSTYATRMGEPDCAVPDCGRRWLPTRPTVATGLWPVATPQPGAPITALLHWKAGGAVVVAGSTYGHKDISFAEYRSLPRRVGGRLVLALGGGGGDARAELSELGWELVDPLAATRDAAAYRRFIEGSLADLGIAKHAYTASRSGWFSDRATCFLAMGRPVLHEDTGFSDRLADSPGVISFRDLDSLVDGIGALHEGYEERAAAARRLAEEQFEARTVIEALLVDAGVRARG